jgi:putative tributyrin esterase
MAFLTCNAFSEALGTGVTFNVVLPQATETQIGVDADVKTGDRPVLYLLHGLSDDHSAWMRYTSIERYATEAGLAVVMPAAGRSFYANEAHGHRYFDYVAEELPGIVGEFFRVSSRREDTFVAGLSMGGYGAMKVALTFPERYAAVASMSGGLDILAIAEFPERREELERIYGASGPGPADDLFALLSGADPSTLPPMHISCGTEDLLAGFSQQFATAASELGCEVTVDMRPGEHTWSVWDDVMPDVIAWLPIHSTS